MKYITHKFKFNNGVLCLFHCANCQVLLGKKRKIQPVNPNSSILPDAPLAGKPSSPDSLPLPLGISLLLLSSSLICTPFIGTVDI